MQIEDLIQDRFQVEFKQGDTPQLLFKGKIDTPNPDKCLDPYFARLHERLLEKGVGQVECNFHELQFLNSNGIKSLVNWILKINALEESKMYKVVLVTNQEHTWQRSSINVLSLMAPKVVVAQ